MHALSDSAVHTNQLRAYWSAPSNNSKQQCEPVCSTPKC